MIVNATAQVGYSWQIMSATFITIIIILWWAEK